MWGTIQFVERPSKGSDSTTIRISKKAHEEALDECKRQGIHLNAFIEAIIARAVFSSSGIPDDLSYQIGNLSTRGKSVVRQVVRTLTGLDKAEEKSACQALHAYAIYLRKAYRSIRE